MSSNNPKRSTKICATLDCGKFITARGFCPACYYRKLRKGEIQSGSKTNGWKHRLSNIDSVNQTAICLTCGPVKIHPRNIERTRWRCGVEANHRAKLYKRAYRQEKKNQLQDCCEICGSKTKLCWDHNHDSNEFRGTLCSYCNTGLGMFRDNPSLLEKASRYLYAKGSSL